MTIREFHSRLKNLDIQYLKEEAVFQNRDEIVKLNQSQMHLGKTSKGNTITPLYFRSYAEYKSKLASYEAPNNVPDLFVTGDFYKGMDVEIMDGEYDLFSRDKKADDLLLKYKDIFGLTDENIKKARLIVTKTFVILLKEKMLT